MLRDEVEEQRAPNKSSYLATSPLVARETFTNSQETTQLKEIRKYFSMLHILS